MMVQIVTAEWLMAEIDANLGYQRHGRTFWTSVEKRKTPSAGEPNWRYSFNPGEVPVGFEENWQAIKASFEERYALAE